MNSLHTKQQGGVHLVITIILTVLLVGALGFVFWQNFIQKEPQQSEKPTSKNTSTISGVNKKSSDKREEYKNTSNHFSIKYPVGWTTEDSTYGTENDTYSSVRIGKKDATPLLNIEVYSKGNYVNTTGMGVGGTAELTPVDNWYVQQGVEYAAKDSILGSENGGYAYKVVHERGQAGYTVLYVLQSNVLYRIWLYVDDAAYSQGDDPDTIKFSDPDIKQVFASFHIL